MVVGALVWLGYHSRLKCGKTESVLFFCNCKSIMLSELEQQSDDRVRSNQSHFIHKFKKFYRK